MRRNPYSRAAAFSLAELIVALAAATALFCIVVPAVRPSPANERRVIHNEAQALCIWIKHHMTKAAREGVDIKFILTDDADKNYMVRMLREREICLCQSRRCACLRGRKGIIFLRALVYTHTGSHFYSKIKA